MSQLAYERVRSGCDGPSVVRFPFAHPNGSLLPRFDRGPPVLHLLLGESTASHPARALHKKQSRTSDLREEDDVPDTRIENEGADT